VEVICLKHDIQEALFVVGRRFEENEAHVKLVNHSPLAEIE